MSPLVLLAAATTPAGIYCAVRRWGWGRCVSVGCGVAKVAEIGKVAWEVAAKFI